MKRKILCLCLTILLTICMELATTAAAEESVNPRYEKISTVYANISLNNSLGIVSCTGRITAKNTYPVSLTIVLDRYVNGSWVPVKTWTHSGTLRINESHQYAVASGYTYRVTSYGYVYDSNGNILESGSTSHSVYYPPN